MRPNPYAHSMKGTVLALALLTLIPIAKAQDTSAEPKPGDPAASGNLIIHVFHQTTTGKPLPAELKSDYGVMVINLDYDHPSAHYRLASRAAGRVQDFDTLKAFEAALAKLPKGAQLTFYDKCLISTSEGLEFRRRTFRRTCERMGLQLADDDKVTCTCSK